MATIALMTRDSRGPLALAGGNEFNPGNEAADGLLVRAAGSLGAGRPAFVIATAAARQGPDSAVEHAREWFAGLGLDVVELPLRRRGQANDWRIAELASQGRFFYLCGGDPGIVPTTLRGTRAWDAILQAWRGGAALAGSSAGAMALGEWTLVRARMPGDSQRQARGALGVVPGVAVLPHFETFGHRWVQSAREAVPERAVLVGIDERTAAIWQAGAWLGTGPGSVTFIAGGRERRFGPGERIEGLPVPIE